jgi:hypothetical protein
VTCTVGRIVDGPETDVPLCCVDFVPELTAKKKFTVNVTEASRIECSGSWNLPVLFPSLFRTCYGIPSRRFCESIVPGFGTAKMSELATRSNHH